MWIHLDTPIQFLKGVGPALGDRLRRKGIMKIKDLVEFIPRAYEDQRFDRKIENLVVGETVKLKAQVLKTRQFNVRGGKRKIYELVAKDETGSIVCKFFRLPFNSYFNNFPPFTDIFITGQVSVYNGQKQFHHPSLEIIQAEDKNNEHSEGSQKRENALIPIYSETEGLTQKKIRSLIDAAFKNLSLSEKNPEMETDKLFSNDPLPDWLIDELKLPQFKESLQQIHYPELNEKYNFHEFKTPYHYRLIFEEFFEMELLCAFKKQFRKKTKGISMPKESLLSKKMENTLGFKLTNAQIRAINEIILDLKSSSPMSRLVQGDVGCGKTLVALFAALHAIGNDKQVVLMAPTEILAEQHFKNTKNLFEPLGLNCALLTGSTKTKEKAEILEKLASGKIHICVGTHALIEDPVIFKKLGLVIVDEQHRFGVQQRQKLKNKGSEGSPHFLIMTATPIPRTLAMSLYGDLEVSVIDELPPGRTPIQTKKLYTSQKNRLYEFLQDQLKSGRQAYIVYPLVEESETLDLKNATDEFEKLKTSFPDYKLALLHGRMKAKEKQEIMTAFKNKDLDILVSTTVIEVGVDVPNANVMIIENAERFGLSQLHQLRGRVGRGSYESFCFLVLGNAVSEIAKERADIMVKYTDGFKIAEFDLKIRGPGEFMGAKQSGLPLFKFAQLGSHNRLLELARKKAFQIFDEDPNLAEQKNHKIKAIIKRKTYKIDLSEIG